MSETTGHKNMIKETLQRAMADWMVNQDAWSDLLAHNLRAWERIESAAMIYKGKEESALISEVNGRLCIFPHKKYAQAARNGVLRSFNRAVKKRGFHWSDAEVWICMDAAYSELQRALKRGWVKTPTYNKAITRQRLGTANSKSLQTIICETASRYADHYVDKWDARRKKGLASGSWWAVRPAQLSEHTRPKVTGRLDTVDDDRDISEDNTADRADFIERHWARNEKPALAVEPISGSCWREGDPGFPPLPYVIFASDGRTPGTRKPRYQMTSLLDLAVEDHDAYMKQRGDEPSVKRKRVRATKTRQTAMDTEDDITTQEDEYVFHKTFGKVLLIRVLADKQRAWIEKRKERTLVQVADLQNTLFPKEDQANKVQKDRKHAVEKVA